MYVKPEKRRYVPKAVPVLLSSQQRKEAECPGRALKLFPSQGSKVEMGELKALKFLINWVFSLEQPYFIGH